MKMRSVLVALSLGLLVAVPASASVPAPAAMAAIDANKILAEVDRRASVFNDQQYKATMTVFRPRRVSCRVRGSLESFSLGVDQTAAQVRICAL